MKVEKVVLKETINIAIGILVCSIITQIVFLIIGKYDLSVLFGTIYGGIIALLNFFLLGLTVQQIADMEDANQAKRKMQSSYSTRQLGLLLAVGIGLYISTTYKTMHWVPIIIAIFYPRITIFVLGFFYKKYRKERGEFK